MEQQGMTIGEAWRRLRAWMRRDRHEQEMQEEIAEHLEQRRQQLIDDGLDPVQADQEARRRFGNVALAQEDTREQWGFPSVDALLQDLRFGARLLVRAPLSTAICVVSLAIGIGTAA